MYYVSRRGFLRTLVAASTLSLAAGALGACAGDIQPSGSVPGSTVSSARAAEPSASPAARPGESKADPTALPSSVTTEMEVRLVPSPTPAALPHIAVVKGNDAASITEAAITAIGGIERFVKPGKSVIIKPNICRAAKPEVGATTTPEVVGKLVELSRKAGASSVRVMDLGWAGESQYYQMTGIEAAVKAAGGQMLLMDGRTGYVKTPIPKGRALKEYEIFSEALKTDVLINVPIAKNHSMSILTLGIKNLMGLVKDRPSIHANFAQRLPDLFSVLTPTLTVIDATRVMIANGPTGGRLEDLLVMNTVIASPDTVAADAYATRFWGLKPKEIPYIRTAAEMGLGSIDLQHLRIAELQV